MSKNNDIPHQRRGRDRSRYSIHFDGGILAGDTTEQNTVKNATIRHLTLIDEVHGKLDAVGML